MVAIFVGSLPKVYRKYLPCVYMITGSGTCKWYINGNAAEVHDFQDRLPENFPPIEWLILIVILTSSSLRISRKILKETAHERTLLSPHEFIAFRPFFPEPCENLDVYYLQ